MTACVPIRLIIMHQLHHKHVDLGYTAHNTALKKFGRTVSRQPNLVGMRMKKIREPQLIIIRNKFTKEIVDLEVGAFACFIVLFTTTL